MPTIRAYIGVGANLGDATSTCRGIPDLLSRMQRTQVIRSSNLYRSAPVGGPPQPWYINCVLCIETSLSPQDLLAALQKLEVHHGRVRLLRDGPRPLDLDILFYGDQIVHAPNLTIPHPRAHERSFVLQPMAELAPDFLHPVFQRTMRELLHDLHEPSPCKPLSLSEIA